MENLLALEPLQVIWDYLGLHQTLEKADCIVGFGNFNDNIARRAAELYHQGLAPKVLFTGGLGRNTLGLLPEPEAERFARVAMECGVPEADIIREDRSANTAENIRFTKTCWKIWICPIAAFWASTSLLWSGGSPRPWACTGRSCNLGSPRPR